MKLTEDLRANKLCLATMCLPAPKVHDDDSATIYVCPHPLFPALNYCKDTLKLLFSLFSNVLLMYHSMTCEKKGVDEQSVKGGQKKLWHL